MFFLTIEIFDFFSEGLFIIKFTTPFPFFRWDFRGYTKAIKINC
jgi:hypothetical protein